MARPGEANRNGDSAQGSQFTFLVNDQYDGEARDDRIKSGRTGPIAFLFHAKDVGVFEFDKFDLRAP